MEFYPVIYKLSIKTLVIFNSSSSTMHKNIIIIGLVTSALFIAGCGNSTPDPNGAPDKVASLNCDVRYNRMSDTISVTNKDSFPYKNCTAHLNESGFMDEGYTSKTSAIAPGQTQNYDLSDFAKSDGTRFQISETKIVQIDVETKNDGGFATGVAELKPTD